VQMDGQPYLVADNMLYHWTPFGYDKNVPRPSLLRVNVLTPKSTVNAFRAGYVPQMSIRTSELPAI